MYFHNYDTDEAWGPDAVAGQIQFGGNLYNPIPIEGEGFEMNTTGSPPSPSLRISNIQNSITALLLATSDLHECTIVRLATLTDYLDGQPEADGTQHLVPDAYIVERVKAESEDLVELELKSAAEFRAGKLPGRIIESGSCWWGFRDADCGYTGSNFYDKSGAQMFATNEGAFNPATDYDIGEAVYIMVKGVRRYYVTKVTMPNVGHYPPDYPAYWEPAVCKKTLNACRKHYGATARLPFGGFPGTNRIPNR